MKKLITLVLLVSLSLLGVHYSYAGEGDTNFTNVVASGDVTVGDDLSVSDDITGDDITAGDDLIATDDVRSGSTGDIEFRSTLLANGRAGGASTLGSSSTQLTPTALPYLVVYKKIGGGNGLDGIGWGTRLQDGTPGQTLCLVVTELQSGGTWVITPVTATGYSSVTLNAAYENVTLVFIDTTTGWVVTGGHGFTLTGLATQ